MNTLQFCRARITGRLSPEGGSAPVRSRLSMIFNKRNAAAVVAATLLAASAASTPAQAVSRINSLKATDAELTKALSDLNAQVKRQQAEVDAAAQSVSAADEAANRNNQAVIDAEAKIDVLRAAAAQRAVEQYMRPQDDSLGRVLSSDGFTDASRRQALLQEVNGRGQDAIEELSAARAALVSQRTSALAARTVADQRRATAQQKLDQLRATRAEKQKLDKDLQDRIETYAAEDDAGAAATTAATTTGRANRASNEVSDDSRISASGMVWPASGPVRSPFGYRWGRQHTGIDIGGSEGDPIYAAKGGTVVQAGYDGGYGNLVKIDSGAGVETWYAHQSRIITSVGATVNAGQLIGYVGHTGRVVPASAAGAHLHFEVRIGGTPRNPQSYLP